MHATRTRLESRVTALLLDGHELLRLGLRTLLEAQRAVTIVGEAGTIAEAMERTLKTQPALLITAADLPDGDAAEVCRRIAHKAPATRVVVLSDDPAETAMMSAARAGASAYLSISMRGTELCRAIRAVVSGESLLDGRSIRVAVHRLRRDLQVRDHLFTLTPQERRVMGLVAEGKTNKEIGVALRLSEKTVKNYLSHAFEKLQVSRRSQAAVLFTRDQRGSLFSLSGSPATGRVTCVA